MGDLLKYIGVAVLALLLGAALKHFAFPRTETVQLPGSTDTVRVTETEIDSIVETKVKWRETVTTDTVTVTETRFETDTVFLAVLPPRWYLDEAAIGSRGDTSTYSLVWLEADSTGIRRRRAVERQVTLGPVREIRTDSTGLHVDYAEPRTCPSPFSMSGLGLDLPFGAKLGPGATAGLRNDGKLGFTVGVSITF